MKLTKNQKRHVYGCVAALLVCGMMALIMGSAQLMLNSWEWAYRNCDPTSSLRFFMASAAFFVVFGVIAVVACVGLLADAIGGLR